MNLDRLVTGDGEETNSEAIQLSLTQEMERKKKKKNLLIRRLVTQKNHLEFEKNI